MIQIQSRNSFIGLIISFLLTFIGAAYPSISLADSWLPPTPITSVSNSGKYRLTIFPASVFESGPDRLPCEAALETLEGQRYVTLWRKPIANEISPSTVFLADDGRWVTLDNWARIGKGSNVIVFYDANGEMIKNYVLDQLLTKEEINPLTRTPSTVFWRERQRLTHDGELEITLTSGNKLRFNMADGTLLTSQNN